jgi:hypothetical protein
MWNDDGPQRTRANRAQWWSRTAVPTCEDTRPTRRDPSSLSVAATKGASTTAPSSLGWPSPGASRGRRLMRCLSPSHVRGVRRRPRSCLHRRSTALWCPLSSAVIRCHADCVAVPLPPKPGASARCSHPARRGPADPTAAGSGRRCDDAGRHVSAPTTRTGPIRGPGPSASGIAPASADDRATLDRHPALPRRRGRHAQADDDAHRDGPSDHRTALRVVQHPPAIPLAWSPQ